MNMHWTSFQYYFIYIYIYKYIFNCCTNLIPKEMPVFTFCSAIHICYTKQVIFFFNHYFVLFPCLINMSCLVAVFMGSLFGVHVNNIIMTLWKKQMSVHPAIRSACGKQIIVHFSLKIILYVICVVLLLLGCCCWFVVGFFFVCFLGGLVVLVFLSLFLGLLL